MKINYSLKNVYNNSIFSILFKIVGIFLSFITSPIILSFLGIEKYGIWVTTLSIVSWIYVMDLGLGSGLRNKLTESLANENIEKSRRYIGEAYRMISLIALGILVILVAVTIFWDIDNILKISIVDENIRIIIFISAAFACLNFVLSLVNNILFAMQKSSMVSLFAVFRQVIYIIGLLLVTNLGIRELLIIIVFIEGLSQLIKNIFASFYVFAKYPELRPSFQKVKKSESMEMYKFGIQMFTLQLASIILNSTDNIVILRLFGASEVTPYSFSYKFFILISTIHYTILIPTLSAYTLAYSRKDFKWIKRLFKKTLNLLWLFSLIILISNFIFRPFSIIWLQEDLDFTNGLIISTSIYSLLLIFTNTFSILITATGKIGSITFATVIQAIINIPLSIFFAKNLGLGSTGIIIGSIVVMLIGAIVSMNRVSNLFNEENTITFKNE